MDEESEASTQMDENESSNENKSSNKKIDETKASTVVDEKKASTVVDEKKASTVVDEKKASTKNKASRQVDGKKATTQGASTRMDEHDHESPTQVEENGEQSAREISKIGKTVDDIERKIDEIEKEVDGIEKGYLLKEQIAGACQGLNKRCVTCNEHLMQNTMKLDAVDIPPSETIIRASRKTAVQRIQILLERSDSLEARVAQCIAGSAEKKVTKTRSMNSLRTGQTQSKTEQTDSTSDKAGRSRRKKK